MADPEAFADLAEAIHDRLADKRAAANNAQITSLLDRFEADIAPMVGPIVDRLLSDPATPDHLRPLLELARAPEHFGESVILGIVVGSLIGPTIQAVLTPALQPLVNTAWAALPNLPLSPAVLAEMALKGVSLGGSAQLGDAALAGEAAKSGVPASDFAAMTQAAGQSLGFQEALLLSRRNQLTGTTLQEVLQYSNINPKFYAAAENLVYASPGVGSVLMGRTKNRLTTDAEAQTLYEQAGGNPANYAWELASVGRPLGLETMARLVNRGHATAADLAQAAAQSDLAIEFEPFAQFLTEYIPPPRSIVPMLRAGAITTAQADTLFQYNGVAEPWRTAFITEATKPKSAAVKELAASVYVQAYELGVETQAVALAGIEAHGYNAADAQTMLDIADKRKQMSYITSALGRIRNHFIAYKITAAQAQADMASFGVNPNQINAYFKIWQEDRAANAPLLTDAMWREGLARGAITVGQFVTAMTDRGYNTAEIRILAFAAYAVGKVPPDVVALPS